MKIKELDYKEILRLFVEEHYSQKKIAPIFKVSRERIRQILNSHLKPEQLKSINQANREKVYMLSPCKGCGKPTRVGKAYCNSVCGPHFRTPEETKKRDKASHVRSYEKNREKRRAYAKLYKLRKKGISPIDDTKFSDSYKTWEKDFKDKMKFTKYLKKYHSSPQLTFY